MTYQIGKIINVKGKRFNSEIVGEGVVVSVSDAFGKVDLKIFKGHTDVAHCERLCMGANLLDCAEDMITS